MTALVRDRVCTCVCLLGLVGLLSSCTEGTAVSPTEPAAQHAMPTAAAINPDAQLYGSDWMYTVQLYGSDVEVYKRSGLTLTPYETLTYGLSDPNGAVATPDGWWYVANGGAANIPFYRTTNHGPLGPIGTLADPGEFPVNVDVTPSRQLVAVSNGGSASRTGSVSVYLNRESTPARILTYGTDVLQGEGVAIDHQGNCFWAFNDSKTGSGSIAEFTDCGGAGSIVVSGITLAGGMTFDQKGNLYYVDQAGLEKGLHECDPSFQCGLFSIGKPPFGDPTNVNFDHRQKHLWVADASGYIYAIDPTSGRTVYRYPVTGGPNTVPFGIAPAPGG